MTGFKFLLKRRWPRYVLVFFLCVLGIVTNCFVIGPGGLGMALHGQNDFRHFYIGAKLAGTGGLYDIDRVFAVQREQLGETSRGVIPTRLPFYYAFISPLAQLPYQAAVVSWMGCMILATALFIVLGTYPSRPILAMVCCWSFPLVFSIAIGQDVAFLLFSLGAALWAIHGRRHWIAGFLLSLCLIKFHLFMLFPLLFIGKRTRSLAAGFLSGAADLLAISFLVAGREWPLQYVSVILDPEVSPGTAIMPNLHGLAAYFHAPPIAELFLSLVVIATVWVVIRRRPFEIALGATLLGSALLSHHMYPQDCAVLIPALLAFIQRTGSAMVRYCALVLLLPVPYWFALLHETGAVTAVLFLLLLVGLILDSPQHEVLQAPASVTTSNECVPPAGRCSSDLPGGGLRRPALHNAPESEGRPEGRLMNREFAFGKCFMTACWCSLFARQSRLQRIHHSLAVVLRPVAGNGDVGLPEEKFSSIDEPCLSCLGQPTGKSQNSP